MPGAPWPIWLGVAVIAWVVWVNRKPRGHG